MPRRPLFDGVSEILLGYFDPIAEPASAGLSRPVMSTARYTLRHGPDDTWAVIDVYTGWPAVSYGVTLIGMELDDADDMVDLLNTLDVSRGRPEGIA